MGKPKKEDEVMKRHLWLIAGHMGTCTRLTFRIFKATGIPGQIECREHKMRCAEIFDNHTLVKYPLHLNEQGHGLMKFDSGLFYLGGERAKKETDWSKVRNVAGRGFKTVTWIITYRRPCKRGGKKGGRSGWLLQNHYKKLFRAIKDQDEVILWDSSLLVLDPECFLKEMSIATGLPLWECLPEEIKNCDTKHLKGKGILP